MSASFYSRTRTPTFFDILSCFCLRTSTCYRTRIDSGSGARTQVWTPTRIITATFLCQHWNWKWHLNSCFLSESKWQQRSHLHVTVPTSAAAPWPTLKSGAAPTPKITLLLKATFKLPATLLFTFEHVLILVAVYISAASLQRAPISKFYPYRHPQSHIHEHSLLDPHSHLHQPLRLNGTTSDTGSDQKISITRQTVQLSNSASCAYLITCLGRH